MKKHQLGVLYILIAAMMYGFMPIVCTFTYNGGNNPYSMAFFRNALVLPILYAMVKKNKQSLKITKKRFFEIFIAAFLGIVVTCLLLFSSYMYIDVGAATTLHFMYPLVVSLLCRFVYHDQLDRKTKLALGLSVIGVACFYEPNGSAYGLLLALLSGISFAIYIVLVDKKKLGTTNKYVLTFYLAFTSAIALFVIDLFTQQIIYKQSLSNYGWMLLISVLTSIVAVICLNEGIGLIGSKEASIYCLMEPVSGMVFGFIFLHESISFLEVIGCCMILGSIVIMVKEQKR